MTWFLLLWVNACGYLGRWNSVIAETTSLEIEPNILNRVSMEMLNSCEKATSLFQICTGMAYWVSVAQIFLSFMCNSPSNILQVPLWFKWLPRMQMILLMATVLEWFTAYCKDSLTSLWSPKQVNLHKPFAVMQRKRGKCTLKLARNLLIWPLS